MIPRTARLPREEFGARGYRTVRTPYFLLKTKENNRATARIGVVAGMSVHKTAAKRNFWKRQAKAVLSQKNLFLGSHEGRVRREANSSGRDILLILSPKTNELTKRQFREILSEAIKKTL